jgi:hypothetical protein
MSNRPMLTATRSDLQSVSDIEINEFSNVDSALNLQSLRPARQAVRNIEIPNVIRDVMNTSSQNQSLEKKSEVEVFFTTDRKLLDEYYNLRHNAYHGENGWNEFNGYENDFDRKGKIIVATKNGEVIGGMRLMFSDQCNFLSNEVPGTQFTYKKLIEKYDKREDLIFAEISALVVAEGNRDSVLTTMMFDKLFQESKLYGCNYVFGVAIALVCRNDRKTIRRLGYDVEIVINFPWNRSKTYNFDRMFPMYTKL